MARLGFNSEAQPERSTVAGWPVERVARRRFSAVSVVQSRPYIWPYHGAIKTKQTALVICVDVTDEIDETLPALSRLVELRDRAASAGVRVVHLPGVGCAPLLAPRPGELTVERPEFGGFTGTGLDLVLRGAGLTDLLMTGFPFELGADCTMREANDLGYECLMVEDCCTGLSDQTLTGAVSSVQMSGGIFGVVATSTEVLAALSDL